MTGLFSAKPDLICRWLNAKGYGGTFSDALLKYAQTGSTLSTGTVYDHLMSSLQNSGYRGTLRDMLNTMFTKKTTLGYGADAEREFFTNTLQDMFHGYQTASYTGVVASRGRLNNFFSTSSSVQYIQSRSIHVARDTISTAQLLFAGIYPSGTNENAIDIIGTITASIEYPQGTYNQVLFSGVAGGSLNNNNLVSDAVTLSTPIPNGATFWVICYLDTSTQTNHPYSVDGLNWLFGASSGEACETSSTPLTDKTMTGGVSQTSFQNIIYRPTAVLGATTKPVFFLMGDSRMRASGSGGNVDLNYTVDGVIGEAERSLNAKGFAYLNAAVSGDSYFNVTQANAYTKRNALAAYCTHIIDGYGINDLGTNAVISTATFAGYIATMRALSNITGKPYFRTTLSPRTTSTDNYTTLENQTAVVSNVSRLAWNNALRNGQIAGVTDYIDVASANESSFNSGKWRIDNGHVLAGDVTATNATKNIGSAGGNFTSADVGKLINIAGVGNGYIKSITDSKNALLMVNAGASVQFATAQIGFATSDGLHNSLSADLNIVNSQCFNRLNYLL